MRPCPPEIDARGPRFGATPSTAVLAAALITSNGWPPAARTGDLAIGAVFGTGAAPYGRRFGALVRPLPRPGIVHPRRTPVARAGRHGRPAGNGGTRRQRVSSATAAANASTSSSVVSNEHIQRTSPVASSHT